ncbi:sulfotransferase [Roseobacter sinensis]|uniref:Sulfotransferase n=1 Tax=Roseobacter sinensis TaxID=2931391 RepID=A0ABT3BJ89_9RHOB|nr:sulfotransferase [Roseobacter sp. WL0113]MCV3273627.1 sulfotransferase [Roseobacter sp. WL0113]
MSVAALFLGLFAFIAVLRVLDAQRVAGGIIDTTQQALSVMMNSDVAEEEKEARVRRASIQLLGGFFWIAAIGVSALGASALIVWGGAALGFYSVDHAIAIALGWPFILVSTVVMITLWIALDKLRKTADETGTKIEVPYSPLEKALHDFAFASPDRQVRLGDLETRLYRRRISGHAATRPVFITSLPRAGTTIMLEGLAGLSQFASATYRHMPFTLSPLLWGGFSRAFRKAGDMSERAHGDGIEVGAESPEAFEEMLWMAFWPDHFASDRITPWAAEDRHPEFEAFFRTHMAKIVATKPGASRYVSKNNANIARLGLLERLFPDATIIVPVRNPRAQVRSLLRQHGRFADLHAREPFARRYMEGLGHFEFGAALRPIAFDASLKTTEATDHPDFWLRYWIAAYEHVLATAGPGTVLVDYDALCTDPGAVLPGLAVAMGLEDTAQIAPVADILRAPPPVPDLPHASPQIMQQADRLHDILCGRAIGHGPATARKVME